MASFFTKSVVASLLLAAGTSQATAGTVLAPGYDIVFPSSKTSRNPLPYSVANSPYFPGPNVNGVKNEVPDRCTVQQAAYVVRHGSRFPDTGSYNSWVALKDKVSTHVPVYETAAIQIAVNGSDFEACDTLSFIKDWTPVLTNSSLQIAQESMTGWKEASDLGYQLRARYPGFYEDGNPFYVWANQYANPINKSRVVQTAQAFLHGYLYEFVDTYGTVVSVNSTGSVNAIGNSLGPSDSCPKFGTTSSGGNNVTDFDATWTPKALKRINKLVRGNLTFTESDILFFPYLCGYETQITGRLSDWCSVFTEDELRHYAYSQDLHYYYKIAEMTSAMGIFDNEKPLPLDRVPENRLYNVAHFITMRGTVAFETMNCQVGSGRRSGNETYVRILLNDAVYPVANCQRGPGKSCLLSDYLALIKKKSQAAGNWNTYCNVTQPGHPEKVGGASFFKDLSLDFLTLVKP
ncbi:hypothetical protein N7539_001209 [Penicillium diatomitis]|uniref:3-phytase n=1 Tax=Penicillium diatomitis TaxID=2819901 RepID=A0A9W9XNB5_9EURO|nr:uncharacterized protein N7539_001209 [Penicillium diatomitis]KAJ5496093.1 hypothetical protein N7539_001209 [Penicillium diatomitis]